MAMDTAGLRQNEEIIALEIKVCTVLVVYIYGT